MFEFVYLKHILEKTGFEFWKFVQLSMQKASSMNKNE